MFTEDLKKIWTVSSTICLWRQQDMDWQICWEDGIVCNAIIALYKKHTMQFLDFYLTNKWYFILVINCNIKNALKFIFQLYINKIYIYVYIMFN